MAITVIAAMTAGAVGAVGAWQIARVAAQGTAIYSQGLIPDQEVGALREAVGRARMNGLSRATAKTPEAAAGYSKALKVDEANIDTIVAVHSKRQLSSTERDALNRFTAVWTDYREARVIADQLAREKRAKEFEAIRANRMTPDVNNALGALEAMSKASAATARARLDAAEDARRVALVLASIIILIGLSIIVVAGLMTIRAIVGPLRRLKLVLASVADGDLTKRVDVQASDEVGQMASALNTSLDTVHDVIRELETTARQLSEHAAHASAQSTTASAAVDLISSEIDAIQNGADDVAANLSGISKNWSDGERPDRTHLQNVINSISEQVSLLNRTVKQNDLAEATRTTASIMDEARMSADSLAEISASLTAMIGVFTLEETLEPEMSAARSPGRA